MWRGNTLLCSRCNRIAGFRYRIGADDLRIYLFPDFDDMRGEIMDMESTHCVFTREDVLGTIDFADFDNAIEEMRAIAVANDGDLIDDCDPIWYETDMNDETDAEEWV